MKYKYFIIIIYYDRMTIVANYILLELVEEINTSYGVYGYYRQTVRL